MSILIKGMGMPFICLSCEFHKCAGGAGDYCTLTKKKQFRFKNRPSWCPLVPVPPHGRLIDADALMEYIKNALGCYGNEYQIKTTFGALLDYIKARINDAPTIIPAEEVE